MESIRPHRGALHFILLVVLAAALILPTPAATPARAAEIDQLGRRVNAPADPKRIVSFAPSITEIVFALGAGDRLKAATMYSDYPPEAKKLPRVGSYVRLDLEKIMALKPDLCLATRDGNPKEVIHRLDAFNIPVYVVNPRNLASAMTTILDLGRILNAEEKANAIVDDMKRRIRRIDSLVAGTTHKTRVFFQIGITPIVSAGDSTFIHELIERAGGKNLASGRNPYPRFSREQVLALAPEVIVITPMARSAAFDRVKEEWLQWSDLPAAKNRRIHLVDSDLFDRPSPRLVDALETLAPLFHPGLSGEK
ncbi:MAG: cobalamin-binding protein [Desulfobacterales bacterium]|nr:cobalamin-binding protein [Desulfobacterales bacterium]